jgi:formylglycine-generating enzyme required for sulfatase activity
MGKHEVTQGEYLSLLGNNPSWFTPANGYAADTNRPVEMVTWNDAVAYCAALTAQERTAGHLPTGYDYRLPTDAEWEYACRGGTTTPFYYGNELRSGMANLDGRYEYPPCGADPEYCHNPLGSFADQTKTVGSYAANALDLCDMHGNVWEWCLDWWSLSLPGGSVTDPRGSGSGSDRVIRGGSFNSFARHCRSAYRGTATPTYKSFGIGFRVILAPQ